MRNIIFKNYQSVRCYSLNGPIDNDRYDVTVNHCGEIQKGEKGPQAKVAKYVATQQHTINRTSYGDYEVRAILPERGDFIGGSKIESVSFDMDQIVIITD